MSVATLSGTTVEAHRRDPESAAVAAEIHNVPQHQHRRHLCLQTTGDCSQIAGDCNQTPGRQQRAALEAIKQTGNACDASQSPRCKHSGCICFTCNARRQGGFATGSREKVRRLLICRPPDHHPAPRRSSSVPVFFCRRAAVLLTRVYFTSLLTSSLKCLEERLHHSLFSLCLGHFP